MTLCRLVLGFASVMQLRMCRYQCVCVLSCIGACGETLAVCQSSHVHSVYIPENGCCLFPQGMQLSEVATKQFMLIFTIAGTLLLYSALRFAEVHHFVIMCCAV